MALYTIIRVYEVPADSRLQATERMLEALHLHTERDYHVNDYIREPGEGTGKGKPVDLRPMGWLTLIREQLGLIKKPAPAGKYLVYLPVHKLSLVTGSRQVAIA